MVIRLWHAGELVNFCDVSALRRHVDVFFLDELGQFSLIIQILSLLSRSLRFLILFLLRLGIVALSISISHSVSLSLNYSLNYSLWLSLSLNYSLWLSLLLLLDLLCFCRFFFRSFRIDASCDQITLLHLLVLIDIEALNMLSASQCHAHLALLFILIRILLLHLANLGVLATLNLTLVHQLVVVL